MSVLQSIFGADLPVFAAPMAGGPTTPELVGAAVGAGGFGFVAGGYRTPVELADQIAATRIHTDRFGVNLFVPNPVPIDLAIYHAYRARLLPVAEQLGVELPREPRTDDDYWLDKLDVLLAAPPTVVSFTFGLPDIFAIRALKRAGVTLAQTVTSPEEAALAEAAGIDVLVVQAPTAGGHSGTFTPERPLSDISLPELVAQIAARSSLPIIAGGGIGTSADVHEALTVGAVAVSVGTALLLAPEAGTSATHRQALTDLAERPTTITLSYTGRPARGIRTQFIDDYPDAPLGYPALHYLTQPIRRAAAARGDAENVHLWAGTGFAHATAQPAADTLRQLASLEFH